MQPQAWFESCPPSFTEMPDGVSWVFLAAPGSPIFSFLFLKAFSQYKTKWLWLPDPSDGDFREKKNKKVVKSDTYYIHTRGNTLGELETLSKLRRHVLEEQEEEEEMLLHTLGFLQPALCSAIAYIHTQIMLYQPLLAVMYGVRRWSFILNEEISN